MIYLPAQVRCFARCSVCEWQEEKALEDTDADPCPGCGARGLMRFQDRVNLPPWETAPEIAPFGPTRLVIKHPKSGKVVKTFERCDELKLHRLTKRALNMGLEVTMCKLLIPPPATPQQTPTLDES